MYPLTVLNKTFFCSKEPQVEATTSSIYSIKIESLSGDLINLMNYKGKYILFVNVASKCGFTSQYKELQKLHER